ncbi:MAG: terpene cyclase/mutase family protein [Pirellulaceae bacterium]|nr:terpene cyclase/mutase family protein [Pirellulaceae bacterium]
MSTPDNIARDSLQPFASSPTVPPMDPDLQFDPPPPTSPGQPPASQAPRTPDTPSTNRDSTFQSSRTAGTNESQQSPPQTTSVTSQPRQASAMHLPTTFTVGTRSENPEQPSDKRIPVIRIAPPWLFSMFIHMLLIVATGLMFLPSLVHQQIELVIGEPVDEGGQLEEPTFDMAFNDLNEVTEPVVVPQDIPLVEDPLSLPPMVDIVERATSLTSEEYSIPEIGSALQGRTPGMKRALLAAYGGTPGTEAAVELALKWFARYQHRNGFWSLTGHYDNGATIENQVAATAMALLAFQGAGHTHLHGDYIDVVRRGWHALLGSQKTDGDFWRGGLVQQRLYAQAQATIALCELYGMTHDEEYREPAQRAINYAIEIQDSEGGWRYEPGYLSDTSVTGWFVMALQSARMAYLEVDSAALEKVAKYLDSASSVDGTRYGYRPREGGTLPMTAEALLCRQYLGWARNDSRLMLGVEYISDHSIDFRDRNVYYWYYATQVIHHMNDHSWDKWNRVMRVELPRNQVQTGKEKGSWSPVGDRWGSHGGRLYTTALSTYMLEVYYRHLPIYADLGQFRQVDSDVVAP